MTADTINSKAAAQGGDDEPVFVRNSGEFFTLMRHSVVLHRLNAKGLDAQDDGEDALENTHILRRIKHRKWLLCFGFAMLYALVFVVAERLFPQAYQAWLGFCMPLAEFVGSLTPRADRIVGQLIANGYPERADDALHGIAMSRLLMIPVFVYLLKGIFSAASPLPVFVSCTRWTHAKIKFRIFIASAVIFATGIFFFYLVEFRGGEDFGSLYTQGRLDDYHRGNAAMITELVPHILSYSLLFASGALWIMMMRPARYTITNQHGDKL